MCGRYNFSVEEAAEIQGMLEEIQKRLGNDPGNATPKLKSGEIYPTNYVPVLVPDADGAQPVAMTWGFPHFQNSGVIINARSETVTDKKMFRDSVLSRRCIIPSTGFFEWSRQGKTKTKYLFRRPGEKLLYMAGCWNSFREKDGATRQRFVILTTAANDSMKEDIGELTLFPSDPEDARWIHDRMPVIITPGEQEEWLSGAPDFERLFRREHVDLVKKAVS